MKLNTKACTFIKLNCICSILQIQPNLIGTLFVLINKKWSIFRYTLLYIYTYVLSKLIPLNNFSFRPNNDTLIVKAQTVIEKDEEITISYYPITQKMGFFERNLHCNKKHFSCQCTLCQNPTVSGCLFCGVVHIYFPTFQEIVYSCLKCRNKAFRHAQVVCCNKCGYKSPFSEVQAYLHQLEMSMDKCK